MRIASLRLVSTTPMGGGSIFDHVADNGGEEYAKGQPQRGLYKIYLPTGEKYLIQLRDGNTHQEQRLIQKALVEKNCPVYSRAGALVQPIWCWEGDDGQQVLSAKFIKYNTSRLSDVVAHHAVQFQRW